MAGAGAPHGAPDGAKVVTGASPAVGSGAPGEDEDDGAEGGDGAPAAEQGVPDGNGEAPAGGKRRNFWRELLIVAAAAAVLLVLVRAFAVQVYRIPSASMENTLLPGDRVLVNRLVYHLRGIDRGDIVVFSGQGSWGPDAPPQPGDPVVRFFGAVLSDIGLDSSQTYYIKRVIGLPGDRVACCTDGKVTVDGVPLSEASYLYPGATPSFPFHVTVPPGHLWVMGDNRGNSDDSRYHTGDPGGGAVPENEVVGRAFLIIWPLSQFRDLTIPPTFQQAALHAASPATAATAAGLAGLPLLLTRRRKARTRRTAGRRYRAGGTRSAVTGRRGAAGTGAHQRGPAGQAARRWR